MNRIASLILLACFFCAPVFAAEAAAPSYLDRVDEKFDFGAINFVAGWTEIISEPMDHYREASSKKDRFLKTTVGIGEGLFNAAANVVGGFLNVITAPMPQRIPLPENGVNLEPLTGASFEDSRKIETSRDPLKDSVSEFSFEEKTA